MFRDIINIYLALFLLDGYSGKPTSSGNRPSKPANTPDGTFLFSGSSLNGWEITDFGPQGPFEVSGASIILGMGEGCTGITTTSKFPKTDYEVTLEAKRISGNDFFCGMRFPVNDSPCTLIVGGWGVNLVGLSCIDGKDASESETRGIMKFEPDRWYRIRLLVTENNITAWIDDQVIVDFAVGNWKLSIRPEVNLPGPFGIASWYTTAALMYKDG
jgi:hypothetical protein